MQKGKFWTEQPSECTCCKITKNWGSGLELGWGTSRKYMHNLKQYILFLKNSSWLFNILPISSGSDSNKPVKNLQSHTGRAIEIGRKNMKILIYHVHGYANLISSWLQSSELSQTSTESSLMHTIEKKNKSSSSDHVVKNYRSIYSEKQKSFRQNENLLIYSRLKKNSEIENN